MTSSQKFGTNHQHPAGSRRGRTSTAEPQHFCANSTLTALLLHHKPAIVAPCSATQRTLKSQRNANPQRKYAGRTYSSWAPTMCLERNISGSREIRWPRTFYKPTRNRIPTYFESQLVESGSHGYEERRGSTLEQGYRCGLPSKERIRPRGADVTR